MRAGWISWRSSKARGIILRDLEPGGLLVDLDHVAAEDLFDFYNNMEEFQNVVLSQFKERLQGHRKQSTRDREMATRDAEACRKDRLVHPREKNNPRGELVFDLHSAKRLLRMDVANKGHEHRTPSVFQRTRPAYMLFKKKIFTHRIYQEVRRQKFLHFLELKREKERPTPAKPRSKVQFTAHHLEKQLARTGRY
jgi:hypothetical protein